MTEKFIPEQLASGELVKIQPPTVIKIGGSTFVERDATVCDIAGLHAFGIPIIVVHGGGPEIDKALTEAQIEPRKINGRRVTDSDTLSVVTTVLSDVNRQIVQRFADQGIQAKGYSTSSGLLRSEIADSDLGYVGSNPSVSTGLLRQDLQQGIIPVIAPLGLHSQNSSQILNINADTVAGAVAASFLGSRLVLITDVPGVLDNTGNLIGELTTADYQSLRASGQITKGMIPKLEAATHAASSGSNVFICQRTVLRDIFAGTPKGTIIKYQ